MLLHVWLDRVEVGIQTGKLFSYSLPLHGVKTRRTSAASRLNHLVTVPGLEHLVASLVSFIENKGEVGWEGIGQRHKVSVMREERVLEQSQQAGDGPQSWAVYLQVSKETDLQFNLLNTHTPCYWAVVMPKLFSLIVVVISG